MKLNKDNQIDFQSNAVFDGYDAKISEENMHKLWDLLQDPYKNSIGAVVREYVSNSFDSHSEADFIKNNSLSDIRSEYSTYIDTSDEELQLLKNQLQVFNNDAVHVSISKDDTGYYWATEDFGVGLSPERVRDVFCSYLKSTKENTNNVIGAFGIGSKSGLSYNDVIFIRSRYNGIESQYMLRKGEKAPRLDIVSNMATAERNGTEIKIYIKSVKTYEWAAAAPEISRFRDECKNQLAYFDNVYFTGCDIDNDYVIAKGINWLKSSNGSSHSGLHMCLGKVAYPIDWNALGATKLNIDAALKFEIGELDIIQTREDVKYTPRTKKTIIEKIELLREELITKYNTEVGKVTDDLEEYLLRKDATPALEYNLSNFSFVFSLYDLFRASNHDNITSGEQKRFQTIEYRPFKAVDLSLRKSDIHKLFAINYKINSYIAESGLKHSGKDVWSCVKGSRPLYRIKGEHVTRKSKYIRAQEREDVILLRAKTKKEIALKSYVKELNLEWDDRANWRIKIKTFQEEMRKFLITKTKSYESIVVDPQWIKDNYSSKKTFDTSKFLVNRLNELNYNPTHGWSKQKYIKGKVDKMKSSTFIIGTKEDQPTLCFIAGLYSKRDSRFGINYYEGNKLKVLYMAPSNLKFFKDSKNVITMDNFKQKKPFIRAMTAYHFSKDPKFKRLYDFILNADVFQNNTITELNPDFEFGNSLKSYFINNLRGLEYVHNNIQKTIWENAYEYALENNIFEEDIVEKMNHLYEYFDFPLFADLSYRVSVPNLASYVYLHNKVAPRKKYKRLAITWLMNYKEEELSWLDEKTRDIINKIQFRNVSNRLL